MVCVAWWGQTPRGELRHHTALGLLADRLLWVGLLFSVEYLSVLINNFSNTVLAQLLLEFC